MVLLSEQILQTYCYVNTLRVSTLLTILLLTNESTFTNQTLCRPKFVTVTAYLCKFISYTELPLAFTCLHFLGKTSTCHRVRNPKSDKEEPSVSDFDCFKLQK